MFQLDSNIATAMRTDKFDDRLRSRLFTTRELTLKLAAPLGAEDMAVQAMEDASPTKWHLAHTTWFFETFILQRFLDNYGVFDDAFNFCFNSYYEQLGARQPRPKREILTRPPLDQIISYRRYVDEALDRLFRFDVAPRSELADLLELGVNHEQQHQELMLTDILALFAANPLRPCYRLPRARAKTAQSDAIRWIEFEGGVRQIGHEGQGFAWDNEHPRHDAFIQPFRLMDRPVTNGEWLEFVEDGGYTKATLWLSDGWARLNREDWRAPLYWEQRDGEWFVMTLEGLSPLEPLAPVAHVSYFEADAFSRWSGKRLPTEFEWECASGRAEKSRNDLSGGALQPLPAEPGTSGQLRQMFGDVWEWTGSAYLPYPGYRSPEGPLGEYNGKFMVGQHVLRGGSCVTPGGHTRSTYRNYFYPHQRWQFTGLRLASDLT